MCGLSVDLRSTTFSVSSETSVKSDRLLFPANIFSHQLIALCDTKSDTNKDSSGLKHRRHRYGVRQQHRLLLSPDGVMRWPTRSPHSHYIFHLERLP